MALPEIIPLREALRRVSECPYQELLCHCPQEQSFRLFTRGEDLGVWVPAAIVGGGLGRIELIWGTATQLGASFPMQPPTPAEINALPRPKGILQPLLPDTLNPGAQSDRRACDPGRLFGEEESVRGSMFSLSFCSDRFHLGPPSYGPTEAPFTGVLIGYLGYGEHLSFTEVHSGLRPDAYLASLLADDHLLYSSDQNFIDGVTRAQELWEALGALNEANALGQSLGAQSAPRPKQSPRV